MLVLVDKYPGPEKRFRRDTGQSDDHGTEYFVSAVGQQG